MCDLFSRDYDGQGDDIALQADCERLARELALQADGGSDSLKTDYDASILQWTEGRGLRKLAEQLCLGAGVKFRPENPVNSPGDAVVVPIVSSEKFSDARAGLEQGEAPLWDSQSAKPWLGGLCIYLPSFVGWTVSMQDKPMTPKDLKRGIFTEDHRVSTGDYYEKGVETGTNDGPSKMIYHAMQVTMFRIVISFKWAGRLSEVVAVQEVRVDAMLMSGFCSANTVHF